jgi:hypothetical protein
MVFLLCRNRHSMRWPNSFLLEPLSIPAHEFNTIYVPGTCIASLRVSLDSQCPWQLIRRPPEQPQALASLVFGTILGTFIILRTYWREMMLSIEESIPIQPMKWET